jgi:DNA-binding transcriptional MerR regulator
MDHPEKRYSIREVSKMTEVPDYVLRQWEDRFPPLKPGRDRAKRRYYLAKDVEIVRRIKQLLWHEKLSTEGARVRLVQELRGEGRPKTRKEALDILDQMENQVRSMLDILDSV